MYIRRLACTFRYFSSVISAIHTRIYPAEYAVISTKKEKEKFRIPRIRRTVRISNIPNRTFKTIFRKHTPWFCVNSVLNEYNNVRVCVNTIRFENITLDDENFASYWRDWNTFVYCISRHVPLIWFRVEKRICLSRGFWSTTRLMISQNERKKFEHL